MEQPFHALWNKAFHALWNDSLALITEKKERGLSVGGCGLASCPSLQAVNVPVTSTKKGSGEKRRSQRSSAVTVYQWLIASWGLCIPWFMWGTSCE